MMLKDVIVLLKKEKKQKATIIQKIVIGIGLLTAVCVAIGILLKPKLGKETFEKIKKKTDKIKKDIKTSGHDITKEVKKSVKNISKEFKKTE